MWHKSKDNQCLSTYAHCCNIPTTRLYLTNWQMACVVCGQTVAVSRSGGKAQRAWERDHSNQANIWQIYPSMNAGYTNQSLQQYDHYSFGFLGNAQLLAHLWNTPNTGKRFLTPRVTYRLCTVQPTSPAEQVTQTPAFRASRNATLLTDVILRTSRYVLQLQFSHSCWLQNFLVCLRYGWRTDSQPTTHQTLPTNYMKEGTSWQTAVAHLIRGSSSCLQRPDNWPCESSPRPPHHCFKCHP